MGLIFDAVKTHTILNLMKEEVTINDLTSFMSMMMLTLPIKSISAFKDQFETQWADLLKKLKDQVSIGGLIQIYKQILYDNNNNIEQCINKKKPKNVVTMCENRKVINYFKVLLKYF